MAKAKTKKTTDFKEPIFTWQFSSSRARGGIVTKYRTQLNKDGTLSCDCGGWVIKRPNRPRWCKHCEAVKPEVAAIMKDYKAGKELPLIDVDSVQTGPTEAGKASPKKVSGRFIEI